MQEKDAAAAPQSKKGESSVQQDSLYDLLYDQNGVSKSANLNQKVVINGPTLEVLDSKGNAISFQPVSEAEAQSVFDKMKWNKSLKIVNPVPQFQSVPATAHFYDLAGGDLDYDNLEAEAA